MRKLKNFFYIACFLLFSNITFAVEKININTADAETISAALKGVGPSKAQAIVEYRKQNGAFKSVEALANVKGIGEKIIEDNKNLITVGDK